MALLAAGLPGVVVTSAGASEAEETQRAEALAARWLIIVVPETELSPQRLAQGIAEALALGGAPQAAAGEAAPFQLGGAMETARHLMARLQEPVA